MMRRLPLLLLCALAVGGCGDDDGGPIGPECGNGIIEAGEVCDDEALGVATCLTLGWTMGTLVCSNDCTYDVTGCMGGGPDCGNWVKEYQEECDTSDLGGSTCVSIGYGAGEIGCRDDCTYDPSECGAPASCGNLIIDGPEECDGADRGGVTCESMGHLGGELTCAANCVLDDSACRDAVCGNGVIEGEEQCDASAFGQEDCVTFNHAGGDLLCTSYCLIDDSQCYD